MSDPTHPAAASVLGSAPGGFLRPAWVEIDLGAVRDNVAELARLATPAALMAVVKADGYGHGAVPVARAALAAGARWLGVALVEEGLALREAGIDAPVLVLSEPPPRAAPAVVSSRLVPVVYTPSGVDALAAAAPAGNVPLDVHVKVDTGMHRVGAAAFEVGALAARIVSHPGLRLAGVCTHFAVADQPDHPYTGAQLARFAAARRALAEVTATPVLVHAANSAGLLAFPESRFDMVRAGISVYGIAPAPALAGRARLRPVLAFKARVSHAKRVPAGARVSYGLRYETPRATRIVTVPVGYADGVPRNLGHVGGEVLVRGRRRPIAGTVTMDQLMVDVADDPVVPGEEVVLIGRQDEHEITAAEWAERLGTIPYEIVCGIGHRVPRTYLERPAEATALGAGDDLVVRDGRDRPVARDGRDRTVARDGQA